MKFFPKVFGFFKSIWFYAMGAVREVNWSKVEGAFSEACQIVPTVLPYVAIVAKATPTRADDQIIALLEKYAVPVMIPYGKALTELEKQMYLKEIAKSAIVEARVWTEENPISNNVLNTAIELAYMVVKNSADKK